MMGLPPEEGPAGQGAEAGPRPEERRHVDGQRAKRAFLAHMRHEFRAPINAILGYCELLLEDAGESRHQAFVDDLQKVHSAGRQLLTLVNGVLDPGEIEGSSDIDIREFGAKVRHALRTPITSVLGYVDILVEEAGDGHQDDLVPDLRKVRVAAEKLLALVNDIVMLWQGEAGKMNLDLTASDAFSMVQEAMSSIRPLAEDHAAVTETSGGSVLVVDDNEINRDLLSRRLERQGHRVTMAENGRQALDMVQGSGFDVVLLDIMMPEMNGFEVLTRLKGNPASRDVPVIMISSLDEIDSVVRCIEMGADDYLPRPFNPTLLKARIDACLEKKRLRDRERAYLRQLQVERETSERLLLNVLPPPIAERLKLGERPIADHFPEVTVLFADLVGFTRLATLLPASELVGSLNEIFSVFDMLAERHGLEKIKTIGDAYMAAAGLPTPRPGHVEATADMALDIVQEIARLRRETGKPFSIRVGINTGPVVAGVIGRKKFIYDLWGDTVNMASRMESHSIPDHIRVTAAVYESAKERYWFEEQIIAVKDKGETVTYLLKGKKDGF